MKHEYTFEELAELRKIYDESGEAGLDITEMRALRKAGLLTRGAAGETGAGRIENASTSRNQGTSQAVYDAIASVCAEGHLPTIQKIADMLHVSKSTVARHVLALAELGRISKDPETGRYRTTKTTNPTENTEKKETIMTIAVQKQQEAKPEEPRTIIANALTGIFDAVSALQRTAFQTNDKVIYGFATKLLTGELMDMKANYSKDTAK